MVGVPFFKSIRNMPLIQFVRTHVWTILFFSGWFSYFTYFWLNAIVFPEDGSVVVNHLSIWGDWAAHFTMGSAMAYRELIPRTSPFLFGAPFSYPFIANLISAILIRLGVPFFSAFVVPSYIFSLVFVIAVFIFYRFIFKKESIAIIASLLFLWNGGIGFIEYFADILSSAEPLVTAINPPREYTHIGPVYSIEWISIVYSMIIPQRAFTLGFPIALIILVLCYLSFFDQKKISILQKFSNFILRRKNEPRFARAVIAGVLIGWMPLLHSHSFLALAILLPFWSIGSIVVHRLQKRSWVESSQHVLVTGFTALLFVIPLYFMYLQKNVSNNFFQWMPGWYANEREIGFLQFWFNNWTVTPLLAVVGLILKVRRAKGLTEKIEVLSVFVPFFVMFAIINLVLLQPFIWDNTKILTWASLGISGLAAYAVVAIWQYKNKWIGVATASLLFFMMTAAGAIDAWRVIRFNLHGIPMYSREDMALVEWTKNNTSPDSVWLTGDHHNHWLFTLTGRQSLLTFRGWLWTHGYDYAEVEKDASSLYAYPLQPDLWEKYSLDYVTVSSSSRDTWHANEAELQKYFDIVAQGGDYTIYAVPKK